jgi:hypothetical protein
MKINKLIFRKAFGIALISLAFIGCQEMDRPALGEYPVDANAVGGPLKFYVAFDGTSANSLMNAVDSVRAKFPTDNPLTSIDGVNGKAIQGVSNKFIAYSKPNDWAKTAKSFTVSFWEKHNGQTKNGTNPGAEEIFSIPSSNGHWSSATMFLLFDAAPTTTAAAVKFVIADTKGDTFLTWEGDNSIEGLLDNAWHHLAFVYDATTSGLTLYVDGKVVSTKTWSGHGAVDIEDSKITGFRIGNGPQSQNDSGDNWLFSYWKGGLDQFRMYSTALTASEVSTLYTKKK